MEVNGSYKTLTNEAYTFFDIHPMPSWLCDASRMTVLRVNKAVVSTFGFAADFWIDKDLSHHLGKLHSSGEVSDNYIILPSGMLQQTECTVTDVVISDKPLKLVIAKLTSKSTEDVRHEISDFQAAIQGASIVSRADKSGNITYVNENFVRISGFSADELVGQNHRIINSGFHPKPFWTDMWKRISSGKTWRSEVKNKAKNGSYYWVDTFIMPFLDADGKVKEFLSIRNDITSRKITEELLAMSNARLSETLMFGRMGSAELDLATSTLHISRELFAMLDILDPVEFEMPLQEFLQTFISPSYLDLIHEKIKEGVQTSKGTRSDIRVDFEMITARQRTIWVEAKGIFSNQTAFGILQDITEKKYAETEINKREFHQRRILNSLPVALYTTDANGFIDFSNEAAHALWGRTPELHKEQWCGSFRLLNSQGDYIRHDQCPMAIAIREKRSVKGDEAILEKPDGTKLNFLAYATPFTNPQGELLGAMNVMVDITDRKKAEEEINKLALIASNTSNAVILTDKNGLITWVNYGFERVTEYTREEVLGKKPGALLQGSDTSPEVIKLMHDNLQNGKGFHTEVLNYSKTGRRYWLDIEVKPILNESNQLTGFMAIESEITERKLSELLLKYSEQKYRELFQINPAPMWVFDTETLQFLDVNESAIHHYGYSREEFLSMTLKDIRPAEDIEKLYEMLDGDNGGSFFSRSISDSIRHFKKDGTLINVEIKSHKIQFQQRQARLVLAHDITQIKEAQDALQESETRLRNLADNLPSGAIYQFAHYPDGTKGYTYFSSSIETLTGFKLSDIMSNHQLLFNNIHPDDQAVHAEKIEYSLQTLSLFEDEFRQGHRDGHYIWLQVRSKPRVLADGTIIFDGIATDITLQKELHHNLLENKQKLNLATQSAGIGVWDWDLDSNVTVWDDNMYTIFGVDGRSVLEYNNFKSFVHPEDIEGVESAIRKSLSERTYLDISFRIHRANDGKLCYIRGFGQGVYNAAGEPTRMVGVNYDITDIKESEIVLRESEERFRIMADSAPVFIWMSDKNNITTYFSKGWYDFTGRTPQQELGKGWLQGIHPDDYEKAMSDCSVTFKNKTSLYMEYRLCRHDGAYRWILDTGVPRYMSNGEFIGYIGSCFDITERKLAEEALQESESRYRAIVNDQIDLICRYKEGGILTFVNRSYADTFGKRPEEMIGRSFLEWISEEDRKFAEEAVAKLWKGDVVPKPVEQRTIVRNGQIVWQEWLDIPIRNEAGKIVEIQGIGRDITYRKELEAQQSRLDKIVRESFNEIYLVNHDSLQFEYANHAALKNLGYTYHELYELRLPHLFNYPDEMGLNAILASLRRGDTDRIQLRLKHKRKDGTFYDVDTFIQVLEKERSFVIIAFDITDKLVTERKLLDTIHEKETLLKEIHHRVKNNLQLISSIIYLKLLSVSQPDIKSFLENTRQKIRSIAMIHERLLQTQSVDQVDISDYLGKLVKDIQVTYARPDLVLEVNDTIDKIMVSLDTAIYCGLIINELMTNSIKHAFTGKSSGKIDITLTKDSQYYTLRVNDNGTSLPADIVPGNANSFGMQLLDVFIKQIGGTIEINRTAGTSIEIKFK